MSYSTVKENSDHLYDAVFPSLAQMLAHDPPLLLQWQEEVYHSAFSQDRLPAAIQATAQVLVAFPTIWARHLHLVMDTMLRQCMEPTRPQMRKAAIKAISTAIRDICVHFPMACFHQERQRFSVGDANGVVRVWDLKTAQLWHAVKPHSRGPIAAVQFHPMGDWMASYSKSEPMPRLWRCDSPLLLLNAQMLAQTANGQNNSNTCNSMTLAKIQAVGDVPDVGALAPPDPGAVRMLWRATERTIVIRVKERETVSSTKGATEVFFKYQGAA
jgi:hypothetical protein